MEKPNIDPQSVDLLSLSTHQSPTFFTSAAAVIDSHTLLGEEGKVIIQQQGEQYQLRKTKSGKLIMTK